MDTVTLYWELIKGWQCAKSFQLPWWVFQQSLGVAAYYSTHLGRNYLTGSEKLGNKRSYTARRGCAGTIFFFLITKPYAHRPCIVASNTRNPQSLYPRNMMCCVHSEVYFPKLLAVLPKQWWVMLSKSEEKAVGWCAKAKLSAKQLHLRGMVMAESCTATGVSVKKLVEDQSAFPKGSHIDLLNHTCLRVRKSLCRLPRDTATYVGKTVKWKQIQRGMGEGLHHLSALRPLVPL